jgi:hypothetical protein
MQLVNQEHEHVQLAYSTKAPGDLAEATAELPGAVGLELQQWQQLAQPARGNPRSMQRTRVPVVDDPECPGEPVEALP